MGVIVPNPTVETEDGATSVTNVKKIEVSDGTLTNDGSRIVSIDTTGEGMASFTVAGATGADQTITDGNTLTIEGAEATRIKTVGVATDKVTIDLSVSGVTAASYTATNLTVDAYGRITAASSGASGASWSDWLVQTDIGVLGSSNRYPTAAISPFGSMRSRTMGFYANTNGDKTYFYPFLSPRTDEVAEIGFELTTAATSACDIYCGIYDSDSVGIPDVLLGKATFDAESSPSSLYETSFTDSSGSGTTISLTKGELYYVAFNRSETEAFTVRSVYTEYGSTFAPMQDPNPYSQCQSIRSGSVTNDLISPFVLAEDAGLLPQSGDGMPAITIAF